MEQGEEGVTNIPQARAMWEVYGVANRNREGLGGKIRCLVLVVLIVVDKTSNRC